MRNLNTHRIAIVANNPIRNDQANGILVSSLWNGWERNSLYGIYFPLMIDYEPHWETCHNYRSINLLGRCTQKSQQTISVENSTSRNLTEQVKRRPKMLGWAKITSEIWASQFYRIQSTLIKQLQEIQPDGIYALIGNYWLSKVVFNSAKALDLPVYLHVTDDYVTSMYDNLPLSKTMAKASKKAFIDLINYSSGRAAISPIMAEAYEKKYDLPWDWFTTLVEPYNATDQIANRISDPDDKPLILTYAGGIRLGRHQSLLALANAIQEISKVNPLKAILHLYAPETEIARLGKKLSEHPFVQVKGWISPQDLHGVLTNSDILVHAESCEEQFVKYTKLSFSTKISQYMMTGKPILGIGPKEVGSMRMIHETDSGLVLTSLQENEMRLLQDLLENRELQKTYGTKAQTWANKWLSKIEGGKRFRDAINRAMNH